MVKWLSLEFVALSLRVRFPLATLLRLTQNKNYNYRNRWRPDSGFDFYPTQFERSENWAGSPARRTLSVSEGAGGLATLLRLTQNKNYNYRNRWRPDSGFDFYPTQFKRSENWAGSPARRTLSVSEGTGGLATLLRLTKKSLQRRFFGIVRLWKNSNSQNIIIKFQPCGLIQV